MNDLTSAVAPSAADGAGVSVGSDALTKRAYGLLQKGEIYGALMCAREALALPSSNVVTLSILGTILSVGGDHATALKLLRQCVAQEPNNSNFLLNLSMELRFAGDTEESERYADRAIDLNPGDCEAHLHRAGLRKQTRDRCHVAILEDFLAIGAANWRGEFQLRFALAKELEDLGEYRRSFYHLKAGADLRRRNTAYDVMTDVAIMQEVQATYSASSLREYTGGYENGEPIFVIGLPRTGTTLVDRILTAHTDVSSAGELQDFGIQLAKMVSQLTGGRPLSRIEFVRASRAINPRELGRRYLEATRYITGRTARFVDKLPGNFLYVGLIRQALPNSKIVHLQRDPMDACYSMYKTPFKHAYPFSYNLDDLGRYFTGYQQLMDHWRAVVPGDVFDVRYEDLIADQRAQSQRLLDFCGLRWQEQTIHFHQNMAPCTTASATQVREPIYSSSVGKWRAYIRELKPLMAVLKRSGIAVRET